MAKAMKTATAPTAMPALAPVDRPLELDALGGGEPVDRPLGLESLGAEEAPPPVRVGAGVDDVFVDDEDDSVGADDACMNASYTEHQGEGEELGTIEAMI